MLRSTAEQAPARTIIAAPHRRLMVAVLQTALDDCRGTATARALGLSLQRDRMATRGAIAFFESPDRRWPFSFLNICDAVGIDADTLRRAVLRHLATDA